MLADLGEGPKVSKEGMKQKAFVSTLEDVPWAKSEQNPGLQYKLLVDASHADTDGFSFGILKLEPGAELAPHHHDPQESYFVLEGEGFIRLNDAEQGWAPGL